MKHCICTQNLASGYHTMQPSLISESQASVGSARRETGTNCSQT